MKLDNLSVPLALPFGWAVSRAYPVHGVITLVYAGAGYNGVLPTSLVSYRIPSGMRYMVTGFVAKEIGSPEYGQVGAFLALNGIGCVEGYSPRRCDGDEVPVYRDYGMGVLEVQCVNMSGTIDGAPEAITGEVRASIYGFLLRPKKRGE